MSNSSVDAVFLGIVSSVTEELSPLGYKKSGQLLRKVVGENAAIIEFQKSRGSTSVEFRFTINLAIVCGRLLDPERTSLTKAKAMDGHFRIRIGEVLPGNADLWWNVVADSDGGALADEISSALIKHAVPNLEPYLDSRELLALWKSGSSPGLTDVQRLRYISEMEAVL
ncbi:DUF4304 domain-containing protein [Caulobacter sp. AP07]|uniref:DUF4304 domain-containing protein n=1 Tax=Caulobacter sp. AP07 TaxID=1144304 RepID=UPI0009DB1C7F|nr:DUF4304 domain-containing protein [Caulobacter sp. AP07]